MRCSLLFTCKLLETVLPAEIVKVKHLLSRHFVVYLLYFLPSY